MGIASSFVQEPLENQFIESSRRCFFENDLGFKRQLIGFNPVHPVILSKILRDDGGGVNRFNPVILSRILKDSYFYYNAEHHCNANGGANPKS